MADFVPAVPKRLPKTGDRVLFVLRQMGGPMIGGYKPKIRPADVVEDWQGWEKHPTGKARGPNGKDIPIPAGCVNLQICLDGHARKDHNAGHNIYEGNVLYDPNKAPCTWHWQGD